MMNKCVLDPDGAENDIILRILSSLGFSFRLLVEEHELDSRQVLDLTLFRQLLCALRVRNKQEL